MPGWKGDFCAGLCESCTAPHRWDGWLRRFFTSVRCTCDCSYHRPPLKLSHGDSA